MLFTNVKGPDTIRAAFYRYTQVAKGVLLACPFFSNGELVREVVAKGCSVRLVVRLSAATSPDELRKLLDLNVPVRYFTPPHFHAKLYIFGDEVALVGSANLTDSGVQSNQEICVGIAQDDPRYDRLVQIFQSYWDEARPLDPETLRACSLAISQNQAGSESTIDSKIRAKFGDVAPSGIQVGRPRKSSDQVYLLDYRRTYQEFLHAFQTVERVYRDIGRRQQPEEVVPLRIEIDSFFSFIRERFAKGDTYLAAPIRHGQALEEHLRFHIEEWFKQRWPYLDDVIPGNYARIWQTLGSPEAVAAASYDEILDALLVCHAFREMLRFHKGAIPALRRDFMHDNELERVKTTLPYLLFGSSDFVERMGNCIFNSRYELNWFGRSCVQELFGWVNREGIPISNGRTVKSLRYLGFDVRVF